MNLYKLSFPLNFAGPPRPQESGFSLKGLQEVQGGGGSRWHLKWATDWLVATQIFFEFSPRKLGKIFTHFDEHTFQMGGEKPPTS